MSDRLLVKNDVLTFNFSGPCGNFLTGIFFAQRRILDMEDVIFFRSMYFNSKAGKHIKHEWFYMLIPTSEIKKLSADQMDAFLMHTYDELFNNPRSIQKMRDDFENFYRELDKRNFIG